ncbi:hypothetical protein XENORESO_006486 [Xenotaenia resolanae]|uniref:Uncharacterized protein n=1 Tax=Xenotaenia resolanae TaxID=208358 RepID=A0ABV0WGI9_9TELE
MERVTCPRSQAGTQTRHSQSATVNSVLHHQTSPLPLPGYLLCCSSLLTNAHTHIQYCRNTHWIRIAPLSSIFFVFFFFISAHYFQEQLSSKEKSFNQETSLVSSDPI